VKRQKKSKPKVTKSPRRQTQQESRRGRPKKAEERRILAEQGAWLAHELKSHPLRPPVDPQFAPYYHETLEGNAQAILQYCDKYWEQGDLADSFYEILGRLFTLKFYRVAGTILSNIERRRVAGWPSKQRTYNWWYRKLKNNCDSARDFLRTALKSDPYRTRGQLWDDYLQSRPHSIQEDLLRHSATERPPQPLSESGRLITLVNEFGVFKLVPEEVFLDLALTHHDAGHRKFRHTPSEIARKYACGITGLSESTVSHWKNLGK
jgi:hypothetical protein